MSAFRLEHAIVDGAVRSGVRVEHADGIITTIAEGPPQPGDIKRDAVQAGQRPIIAFGWRFGIGPACGDFGSDL